MASNSVDSIGKEILEDDHNFLYKYKGLVPIGICGMMDDVIGVTESGVKAQLMNSLLNVKTAEKRLQFGPDKCHTMTIHGKNVAHVETDLFVDFWEERHNKDGNLVESFEGKVQMVNVKEQKYLGFILSNMKNIISKGKRLAKRP